VYHALTRALADPECSLSDVTALVEQDVAMCAKLLQLVNSSFFGLAKRITNIHDAVVYLGANMLKQLVLSVAAFRSFAPPANLLGFSFDALQRDAMMAARLAKQILGKNKSADDAYTAGMLHDIGTLTLATAATDGFREVLAQQKKGAESVEAERAIFGATHAEVGAYLLGLWGLPYTVVEAVAFHHRPADVQHQSFDVLDAVYVASALSEETVYASPSRPPESKLDVDYLARLGVAAQVPSWRALASERSKDRL
jgi:HD-like signal output (HDOD) protein